MTEILAVDEMLQKLQGFDPLRRVLLATPGTLQGTLSAYFGRPIDIEMSSQRRDGSTIERVVDLVLRDEGTVACHAESRVVVDDEQFLKLVLEKRIGLGRIAQLLHRETSFLLETAHQNEDSFTRSYRLAGEGFAFHIDEEFPAVLYPEARS